MKNLAIASVVGSIILYIFLALAHMMLPVHFNDYKYSAAQDSILNYLSEHLKEDGLYALPYMSPEHDGDEQQMMEYFKAGKPSAMVSYHEHSSFGMQMYIMSFIYNFISILIICIAMAAASSNLKSFGQRLWFIMLFAAFAIFSNVMMQYNWDQFPMHYISGSIIDLVLGYLLSGIWLAWYYGRLSKGES